MYQVYVRSFMDSDGDGVGDLAGIEERLDYLSDTLRVDAIWLTPFFPSPMKDFGYDVSDYTGVDSQFGSMDDFRSLIEAVHDREMKLIIDYVANHSSDQHLWFQESRSSRTNPRHDWYVWRDPALKGGAPNNWVSVFGGSAWTLDPQREQYYLHKFLPEQPDLNWRNPAVKEAMFDVIRFWLDFGVDGFRIDAAHYIMKDPDLRDNPPNPSTDPAFHRPMGDYDSQLHIYDKGHPDVHGVYRELRSILDEHEAATDSPVAAIGEIHVFDIQEWVSYYGRDLDELHMPFNFDLLGQPWSAERIRGSVERLEAALPEGAWPNYVLSNHDETRLATRIGEAAARVAAMLLLTLRGTPTIYYGQELGLTEANITKEDAVDPWGFRVQGLGRDGCRTPMPWNLERSGGFSDTAPERFWLPMHYGNPPTSVHIQLGDPHSMLSLYRRLLRLRNSSVALSAGAYATISDMPEGIFAYRRIAGTDVKICVLNFEDKPADVFLPDPARVLMSTVDDGQHPTFPATHWSLQANEGIILQMQQ